jgi:selenocysteine-specific elongation factor
VLTKTDLAPDADWLELVEAEVREVLTGTVLENAPGVRVSARTGSGLDLLKQTLGSILTQTPERPDLGRPRLPVDRVFTMPGFGTVVTGTLTNGSLHLGEDLEILPSGRRGRVRGLQTHRQKEEVAVPGSRTAVNISGVEVSEISRGEVLTLPRQYKTSRRLDVHFRMLPDVSAPLRHGTEIKLCIGTAEIVGTARMIGADQLMPGDQGYLQLELRHPVVAVRGDRYILRRPSPGETLGGGVVLDEDPHGRYKRMDPAVTARFQALARGTPVEILLQAALSLGIAPIKEITARSSLDAEHANQALQETLKNGQLITIENGTAEASSDLLAAHQAVWNTITANAVREMEAFHAQNPLRIGMPREVLKNRLKLTTRKFQAAIKMWTAAGILNETGQAVHPPGYSVHFSSPQQARVDELLREFAASPYATPSIKESVAAVGEDVFNALLEQEILISVSPEVVFRQSDYQVMKEKVIQMINQTGSLTAAQFRDQFNTSRKYALAFLEHLDAIGVTVREGDVRKLK